jgi:hypothetical protein
MIVFFKYLFFFSVEFWSSFYRWKSHSGGAGVDGWLSLLFTVVKGGRNNPARDDLLGCLADIMGSNSLGRTRNVNTFVSSVATAPVTCDDRGNNYTLSYVAGQIGTHQRGSNLFVR